MCWIISSVDLIIITPLRLPGEWGQKIMSETRDVQVDFLSFFTLRAVVESLGGKVLGFGEHHLYAGFVQGWGFTLPGWSYPLVVCEGTGKLSFDDYKGHWGNVKDLDNLRAEYAIETAEQTAKAQGLYCERVDGALKVHHGEGREIWVFPDGRVEAVGFHGIGCSEACASFADALGGTVETKIKPEFYSVQARITQNE